jgi:hypothetical protein
MGEVVRDVAVASRVASLVMDVLRQVLRSDGGSRRWKALELPPSISRCGKARKPIGRMKLSAAYIKVVLGCVG